MYALDVSSNALVQTLVTEIRSAKRECVAVGLGEGESLRCTPDHPLYDPEEGVYAPASEWVEGQRGRLFRVTSDGSPQETEVQEKLAYSGVFEVFDLSVESEHHNYVAAGVLVHNKTFDDSLGPTFPLSGTNSGTGENTDSAGDQSSTAGDTAGEPTGSSSGTAGSSSGATGSSSGATGTSGSSGAAGSSSTTG